MRITRHIWLSLHKRCKKWDFFFSEEMRFFIFWVNDKIVFLVIYTYHLFAILVIYAVRFKSWSATCIFDNFDHFSLVLLMKHCTHQHNIGITLAPHWCHIEKWLKMQKNKKNIRLRLKFNTIKDQSHKNYNFSSVLYWDWRI